MNEELINKIQELLNPLAIDERYKVLEDVKVELEEIESGSNDLGI